MNKARFRSYGDYASSNYGVNSMEFTDGNGNTFYFSYKTLVAFYSKGELICIKNYWGCTTGKHLNWIQPDHSKRVDQETFDRIYQETFGDKEALV